MTHSLGRSVAMRRDVAAAKLLLNNLYKNAQDSMFDRGFGDAGNMSLTQRIEHVGLCQTMIRMRGVASRLYRILNKCRDKYEIMLRLNNRWQAY